jgi:glucans biosynthesis protein C
MKAGHSPEEDSGPVSVGLLGRSRSNDIETLRAVALILMVVGHVIGNTEDSGMRVAAGSAWRHFYDTLSPFRMPLFTAISGYVYAVRPVTAGGAIEFFRGRIPRLLLPLVSVQPLFLLIQKFSHGAHGAEGGESLLSFLLQPHAHFWFLYAMTWIALATPALELSGALRNPFRWSLVLLAACLAKMLVSAPNVLGLDHGFFLFPYFVLGVGLRRFGESTLRTPTNKLRVGGLVAICVVLHQLQLLGILNLTPQALDFTVLIFGLLSTTLAISCRGPIP